MGQDYNVCASCGDIFGDYCNYWHCAGCESEFCGDCLEKMKEKDLRCFVFDKYNSDETGERGELLICRYCNDKVEEGEDNISKKNKIFEITARVLDKPLDGYYAKMRREDPEEFLREITKSPELSNESDLSTLKI